MSNANALLRLYLTKAVRWSPNSVCTLRWLCERISLPEDALTSVLDPSPSTTIAPICDRTRLLEWLLNVPWQKLMTRLSDKIIEDVCALLVNLVLSSRCRQNIRKSSRKREESRESTFLSRQDIYSTDLLQFCYAFLTFKIELSVKSKNERDEEDFKPVSADGSPVFCVQEVFNFLKKCLHDIFQAEDSNDEAKNTVEIHIVLIKIAFLARSLSSLKHVGIISRMDSVDPLIDAMKKHLKNSFEVLTKIDWARCEKIYSNFNEKIDFSSLSKLSEISETFDDFSSLLILTVLIILCN